ncbi:MAG: nucleotidyltransferase domain-containing protein [Rhodobacteraceae bacterium]|nr:nucleotidyltransferase domain-containing protein [Paracoccaceae bacterium]
MHRLIASKQDQIATICRKHRVERLEVFGSAARAIDFDPDQSDIDFLVDYPRPLQPGFLGHWLQLHDELQVVLGCKVDLVLGDSIKNPYLKLTIDQDREVVFED